MALWKADGRDYRRGLPKLVEAPGSGEIPPLGAVEDEIKSGPRDFNGLLRRAAEGFGKKLQAGVLFASRSNQKTPQLGRNLIRSVAPEPINAQRGVTANKIQPELPQTLTIQAGAIVNRSQIIPGDPFV